MLDEKNVREKGKSKTSYIFSLRAIVSSRPTRPNIRDQLNNSQGRCILLLRIKKSASRDGSRNTGFFKEVT